MSDSSNGVTDAPHEAASPHTPANRFQPFYEGEAPPGPSLGRRFWNWFWSANVLLSGSATFGDTSRYAAYLRITPPGVVQVLAVALFGVLVGALVFSR